jgi:hypothetical protein
MVPDEGELKATIAMKQNMLRNELVNRTTASQTSLQNQLANTGRDWASRGAAFFGGRQKQEAEQARQSTADQNLVQSQYAGQQMDLQDKLTTGLAQIRRGQTEAGLTARQQLPIQNAQQGVY